MLNKLTLTCFRKHTDLVVDFTQGIQVIRAPNEGGKSTLLEAISYCLFGSRSLRTPLEQAVTHGQDVKRLKVTLDLTVDGSTYTFSRGKSGAEVTHNGQVFVTGQNQVSSFAASLMGADSDTASRLMLAGQNSIRGALEDGPTALSQMIEDLAGFSTFDQILTAAQSQLTLGSPAVLEERLKIAEGMLATTTASLPPQPDVAAHEKEFGETQEKLRLVGESLPNLRASLEKATKDWTDASSAYLQRTVLEAAADRTYRALEASEAQVRSLTPSASEVVDTSPIEGLRCRIALSLDHKKRQDAYRLFQNLSDGPRWEGTQESFTASYDTCRERMVSLRAEYGKLEREVAVLKGKRFDTDTCSKCGQKLPNAADIAARNREVDLGVEELQVRMRALDVAYSAEEGRLGQFKATSKFADTFMRSTASLGDSVVWDITTYPGTVTWNGPAPAEDAEDVPSLRRKIEEIEEADRSLQRAKARLGLAVEQRDKARSEYDTELQALSNFTGPDADMVMFLTTLKDECAALLQSAANDQTALTQKLQELERDYTSAKALWDMAQSRITDAQRMIADYKADLDALSFNNNLIKKLRTIRPIIANRLWNTVLASVSVMFSTMRKQESWITKEKNGFMVNGQSVESLSGSTLDILGLAIRCAMLRTFLPQCGLLVLDEPMHGCDDNRAEAMLGFLKSAGFNQTLLVSHEEVSESVADNLITLG